MGGGESAGRAFKSRERAVERLVHDAWAKRIRISVVAKLTSLVTSWRSSCALLRRRFKAATRGEPTLAAASAQPSARQMQRQAVVSSRRRRSHSSLTATMLQPRAVLNMPCALAVADPVYEAMTRHRTAYDACMEAREETNCSQDIEDDDRAGKQRWYDVQNAEESTTTRVRHLRAWGGFRAALSFVRAHGIRAMLRLPPGLVSRKAAT